MKCITCSKIAILHTSWEQLKICTYKSTTWRFTFRESANPYSSTKLILKTKHIIEAASYRANNFNLLAASNLHLTKCNQFEQLKIGTYKSATWRFTSRESSNAYSLTKSISHTLLHEHELPKATLPKDVQSSTVFNSLTANNLHLTMWIINSKIAILQTSWEQQKIGT